MPLYEYECAACGKRFEVIQKFSDPPPDACRVCGKGPARRLASSPAIQFKGSGFYITDYPKKGQSDSAGRSGSAGEASKGDSSESGASKSESKGDAGKSDASKGDGGTSDAGRGDAGRGAAAKGDSPKTPAGTKTETRKDSTGSSPKPSTET